MADDQQGDVGKDVTMLGTMFSRYMAHGITPTLVCFFMGYGIYSFTSNVVPWCADKVEKFLERQSQHMDKNDEAIEASVKVQEKTQETLDKAQETIDTIKETIEKQVENGKTLSESNAGIKNVLENVTTQQKRHGDVLDTIDRNTKPK